MIETTEMVYGNGRFTPGLVTSSYVGRVIAVEQEYDRRNHSDTLDYSDWRVTLCTYALVYEGRVAPAGSWDSKNYRTRKEPEALDIQDRFRRIDCTNIFAWRGSNLVHGTADADLSADPEMAEDLAAWVAGQLLIAMVNWARRCEADAAEKARLAKAELDRPIVGKKMVVVSGRKVPKGTKGTVAFINREGSVLLKDDAAWQDRKANGVWVSPQHLAFRAV